MPTSQVDCRGVVLVSSYLSASRRELPIDGFGLVWPGSMTKWDRGTHRLTSWERRKGKKGKRRKGDEPKNKTVVMS